MKRNVLILAVSILVSAFIVVLAGCGNKTDAKLNGTWVSEVSNEDFGSEIKLNNGNFESTDIFLKFKIGSKGTFSTNNGKITINITHILFGGDKSKLDDGVSQKFELDPKKWYSITELSNLKNEESDAVFDASNFSSSSDYTLHDTGNSLTLVTNGVSMVYNRKR